MSLSPIDLNQIINQSVEVSKIRKRELDKKKLEQIQKEQENAEHLLENLVENVNDKDPEINLNKNELPANIIHYSKKANKKNILDKREVLNETYKGNFLDIKE